MPHLIDKSALVAEIENLENKYKKCPARNSYEEGLKNGRLIGYKDALHKINTIEVKEVDLEKEISFQWSKFCLNGKDKDSFIKIATHFFELGLKVNKSLTWEDIANINDIISEMLKECGENILYDTQEGFCKEVLKRFKEQKGEKI